jgi:hypothetical protein
MNTLTTSLNPTTALETGEPEPDVRYTFQHLPLQPFWTWLSGKPSHGEKPLYYPTPLIILASGLVRLLLALAGTYWILTFQEPVALVLLPLCWLIYVSGARLLQVTIVHHSAHLNFTGIEWVDRMVGHILTAALMIQDYDSYRRDHVSIHHSKLLATLEDPDLKFLLLLGFRTGKPKSWLWKHLIKTLFSPRFHFLFIQARLRSNFVTAPRPRRIISWLVVTSFVLVLLSTGIYNQTLLWVFVLGWLTPLIVPYQISSLLQFSSEHRWLRIDDDPNAPAKLLLARLTAGRFMAEPAPTDPWYTFRGLLAWGRWWMRISLLHLPARIFVMVGDLPQHDWHHRHPTQKWTLAAFSRQWDIEAGCPKWPEGYTEVWGLNNAINSLFDLWSKLPVLSAGEMKLAINQDEMDGVLTGM